MKEYLDKHKGQRYILIFLYSNICLSVLLMNLLLERVTNWPIILTGIYDNNNIDNSHKCYCDGGHPK